MSQLHLGIHKQQATVTHGWENGAQNSSVTTWLRATWVNRDERQVQLPLVCGHESLLCNVIEKYLHYLFLGVNFLCRVCFGRGPSYSMDSPRIQQICLFCLWGKEKKKFKVRTVNIRKCDLCCAAGFVAVESNVRLLTRQETWHLLLNWSHADLET